jgi:hypothetical protein
MLAKNSHILAGSGIINKVRISYHHIDYIYEIQQA